jgi:hypothetical protein
MWTVNPALVTTSDKQYVVLCEHCIVNCTCINKKGYGCKWILVCNYYHCDIEQARSRGFENLNF